ncbi:hypothetical protein FRC10_007859 [Ceratobasidium sp. 414]|nr:hypothetical protein FRC10_007859 [Ceratobasidium sp. 414]
MIATPRAALVALAAALFSSAAAADADARTTCLKGGNVRFDRGSGACLGQTEGGDSDAVFLVESGGTVQSVPIQSSNSFRVDSHLLRNVVIGANQAEGIHCLGPCNLYNVWFEDVCEDAITIKQTSGQSNIIGGGAKNAEDKVVQHNGGGTVKIDLYCVQTFGKLYRSCGNCSTWVGVITYILHRLTLILSTVNIKKKKSKVLAFFADGQYKRAALISQIIGSSGSVLAGINSNYGDTAQFDTSSLSLSSVSSICDTYEGNSSGAEPTKLTSDVSNAYCKF